MSVGNARWVWVRCKDVLGGVFTNLHFVLHESKDLKRKAVSKPYNVQVCLLEVAVVMVCEVEVAVVGGEDDGDGDWYSG